MAKSKPTAAKQKVAQPKKAAAPRGASSAKPIKLGGVPNQGKVSN